MIELDGMDEDEIFGVLGFLVGQRRYVAFAGSRVKTVGGQMGAISTNLRFGPVFRGRVIATFGAPYSVPGDNYGAPCCPHFCTGTLTEGAQDVQYQGQPVVMVKHKGQHHHICNGQHGTAVVVEGWSAPYMASQDYGLDKAAVQGKSGMGSHNIDRTIEAMKRMGTKLEE